MVQKWNDFFEITELVFPKPTKPRARVQKKTSLAQLPTVPCRLPDQTGTSTVLNK